MSRFIRNAVFAAGFVAVGTLGTLSLSAVAERGPRGEGKLAMLFDGVGLTEAQEDQLAEMTESMRAERREHRSSKGEKLGLLTEVLSQDTVDREAVYAEIDQRLAERRELLVQRADTLMDFAETLDEDQRAALLDNVAEMQARVQERMEQRALEGAEAPERPERRRGR